MSHEVIGRFFRKIKYVVIKYIIYDNFVFQHFFLKHLLSHNNLINFLDMSSSVKEFSLIWEKVFFEVNLRRLTQCGFSLTFLDVTFHPESKSGHKTH